MANRAFISRFSPNRTDPDVLEAIFVQRHKLAEVWLERLRDSALTEVKHHLLAIGPRGCGKSHLVSVLVHRLRKDPAVCERTRFAWLPEDETTSSFWKFLLRILRALNAEYGDEFPPPPRDQIANAADERRSTVLADYLLEKLHGRTLLVIVENLDDVMRGLKDEGQKRWRAFLQEHRVAATLATAQRLTGDTSNRDRPFFNFFQVEHLQPLTADEALALLQKIAEHNGDASLAAFLQSPAGRARVRAIRHIAGGSHRIFIILAEFVTRENLDDLVSAFEELLDELTPYYQERLRWLPNQQREIVEFLCRQVHTAPVKEIAAQLFLTEQTAAAQLKQLKDKGYMTAASHGRESRYELAEPLMRLCVEVKDPQREPIRLIVEFLRIWYERGNPAAMHDQFGPTEAYARYQQGRFKLDLGKFGDALDDLRGSVQLNGNIACSLESLAEAYTFAGDWGAAERVIADRFHLPPSSHNPARSWHLSDFIIAIFRTSTDASVWTHRVNRLAEIAAAEKSRRAPCDSWANPLAQVGQSLVNSLPHQAYAATPADTLNSWADVWREVARHHQDLSLAARLFAAGVRYRQSSNELDLLDLVQEERAILRDLFRLDDPVGAR